MAGTRSRPRPAAIIPTSEVPVHADGVSPVTPTTKRRRKAATPPEPITSAPAVVNTAAIQAFRTEEDIRIAVECVLAMDPVLAPIIEEHGHPVKLLKQQDATTFQALAKTIVFQQLHGKAAAAIYDRVLAACKDPLTPTDILKACPVALRGCGLSERKLQYLIALATHFNEAHLTDDAINDMSDQDLKESLTTIKGIGPWSVDMLMMFNLGRVNVLPVGDLGVRKGMQQLYQLPTLPTPAQMETIAQRWTPYRSIGTYLMWRIPTPKASPKSKATRSPAKTPAR